MFTGLRMKYFECIYRNIDQNLANEYNILSSSIADDMSNLPADASRRQITSAPAGCAPASHAFLKYAFSYFIN